MKEHMKIQGIMLVLAAAVCILPACREEPEDTPVRVKTKLSAPQEVRVSELGPREATLKWEPVGKALCYDIYLGENDSVAYTRTFDTTAVLSGLAKQTSYSIRMQARAASQSAYTSSDLTLPLEFTTTDLPVLGTPLLQASTSIDTIFVVWEAVENAAMYEYIFNSGEAEQTESTSLCIAGLKPDTQYTLRLRALPSDEEKDDRLPGPWAEISVTTEHFTEYGNEDFGREDGKW